MSETLSQSASTVVVSNHILGLVDTVRSTVPQELFHPKTLHDLRTLDFQTSLVDFIKNRPQIDFVYRFDLPEYRLMQGQECLLALPVDTGKGLFVGGSTALHYITCYLKGENNVNWKSTDVDLFFLNCVVNSRMEGAPGALDFVFCKEKTIEDVLLNFDLPCCRVGFDMKYNFYISAQALVSIFTGKMYLPSFFSTPHDFTQKLAEYKDLESGWHHQSVTKMIVNRFYERVKKYQSRGFKTVYTNLDYMLPWVQNRFTYIDFSVKKVDLNIETKYFSCYECGSAPQQAESVMQKYDCVMCGGRKCHIHTKIDENLTCPTCGKDKLCNNCLAFGKCCRNK